MKVYLNRILCVAAPYRIEQQAAIAWLMKALQHSSQDTSRALNLYERLISNHHIGARHTVLADFSHDDWDKMELFHTFSPSLEHRMMIFARESLAMAKAAFKEDCDAPSHLIEVSCTGYDAPYPSQKLVLEKGWQDETKLLKLGHMGCYACVPAVNLASALIQAQNDDRTVSILSTELCSLHLNPQATESDQIVANILFADGAARLDLSQRPLPGSLAVIDQMETLIPDTTDCMTWVLADSLFRMTLSKKVGFKISEVLHTYVDRFLAHNNLKREDISFFAIHPGGPLIIETVQRALGCNEESVRHSKTILKEYGNMSSSTLPHIWASMQSDTRVKAGDLILSMAFGPGLTLTMNILAKDL